MQYAIIIAFYLGMSSADDRSTTIITIPGLAPVLHTIGFTMLNRCISFNVVSLDCGDPVCGNVSTVHL